MKGKVNGLIEKYGNPLKGSKHWNGDLTDVIYFLVEKDYRDVMLFAARLNLEGMEKLATRLEDFEEIVNWCVEML